MKFDTRIAPSRPSATRKWTVFILILVLFLGGAGYYYTTTLFNFETVFGDPGNGTIAKTIPLPKAKPLSEKIEPSYLVVAPR